MLNTRELESRWLKYKIKSYIPHTIITLSSVIIIAVISVFFTFDEENQTPLIAVNKTIEPKPKQGIAIEITKETQENKTKTTNEALSYKEPTPQKAIATDKNSLTLTPSLGFIKNMQHSNIPYYTHESPKQEKKILTQEPVEEVQDLTVRESNQGIQKEAQEEVQKITINRRNIVDDIQHIIKRFKKNNNPALSLFVAKKYYELGDYHKAYNYALITNQINSEIDASWIVFAKSLVKLNEKNMAIKTLKEYIKSSHSSSAQILLDEIVSGKFK